MKEERMIRGSGGFGGSKASLPSHQEREGDLCPIGAMLHRGGGRWAKLYGARDASGSTAPLESPLPAFARAADPEDPADVVAGIAAALRPEVRAGRLDDRALLDYAPLHEIAGLFRPPPPGVLELLDILDRVPEGVPWEQAVGTLANILSATRYQHRVEGELRGLFAGSGLDLREALHQRLRSSGLVQRGEPRLDKYATHSAAHYTQTRALKTLHEALDNEPLPRLRTALVLAEELTEGLAETPAKKNVGMPNTYAGSRDAVPVLHGRLRRRRLVGPGAAGYRATEDVWAICHALAPGPGFFDEVTARLTENLDKPRNVRDMARIAGVSDHDLKALFRRAAGITPAAWLKDERMQTAEEELAATKRPVHEVAACVGISTKGFPKVFKAHSGMLPAEYRRAHAQKTGPEDARAAATLEWAAARLREQITTEDLAARAGYSTEWFVKKVREITGQAPREWLIRQRVRRAREILASSDTPLDEVARECGFGHRVSLHRAFKERVGYTPAEFRRRSMTTSTAIR